MRGRSILTILFLVTSLGTMAGSGPYFDTYTHHMEPGEWELEAGIDAVNPPGKPWAWGQVLELEHGFNAHFASSLYLLGSKLPGESWRLDGYQVEGRFGLVPHRQEHYLQPFVAFALGRRTSLKLGVALGLTSGSTDAVRALVTIGL